MVLIFLLLQHVTTIPWFCQPFCTFLPTHVTRDVHRYVTECVCCKTTCFFWFCRTLAEVKIPQIAENECVTYILKVQQFHRWDPSLPPWGESQWMTGSLPIETYAIAEESTWSSRWNWVKLLAIAFAAKMQAVQKLMCMRLGVKFIEVSWTETTTGTSTREMWFETLAGRDTYGVIP